MLVCQHLETCAQPEVSAGVGSTHKLVPDTGLVRAGGGGAFSPYQFASRGRTYLLVSLQQGFLRAVETYSVGVPQTRWTKYFIFPGP